MNAQALAAAESPLTVVALQNVDILRALDAAETWLQQAEVAKAAGVPTKNIGRQLQLLVRDGLVEQRGALHQLANAGKRALEAIDLANGATPTGGAGDRREVNADLLMVPHHQLRANPLNPRKHFDPVEIEGLAETIAERGILQNLLAFPADAEGVHTLAAGERRWRAVGLLIEQGRWPQGRALPVRLQQPSAGQVSYVALVENGQRENLSLVEQARAYRDLTEETGWSGREAALKTGRDPRTVQEMLKVLREATPEAIARHEAAPGDFTWEDLRESVRQPKLPLADPDQLDIERPPTSAEERRLEVEGPRGEADDALAKLNAKQVMVLVELADKYQREPEIGGLGVGYTRVGDHYPDPMHAVQALLTAGAAGFMLCTAGEFGRVHAQALHWLQRKGWLTSEGDRDAILTEVRAAGAGKDAIAKAAAEGRYITPWLNPPYNIANPTRANQALLAMQGGAPSNSGGKPKAGLAGLLDDDFSRQLREAREAPDTPAAVVPITEAEDPDAVEAAKILAEAKAGVETGLFGRDGQMLFRDLLQRAGLEGPFAAGVGDSSGAVWARQDEEACTVDVNRELPDALAQARAELIAFALNAAIGHSHKSWA